jgi:acetyl-CoA carboxylase biotin carboxylase subunit
MTEYPELRERMGEAALRIARAANYHNAGTLEFLVDRDRNFYFLEMNTRLQVEHPVTELVTGLDLVQWQLRIAAGERLTVRQEDVRWEGSAIECRIYAEDPERQFMPSPGRITRLKEPAGPGVRLDSGIYEGWEVPVEYDPLLAKLAVWGPSREEAVARMKRALTEYVIAGIATNREFFGEIMEDAGFRAGALSTAFLEEFFARRPALASNPEAEAVAALAAVLAQRKTGAVTKLAGATGTASAWLQTGRESLLR